MQIKTKERRILLFSVILSLLCFCYLCFQPDYPTEDIDNTQKVKLIESEEHIDAETDYESMPDLRVFREMMDQMKYLRIF